MSGKSTFSPFHHPMTKRLRVRGITALRSLPPIVSSQAVKENSRMIASEDVQNCTDAGSYNPTPAPSSRIYQDVPRRRFRPAVGIVPFLERTPDVLNCPLNILPAHKTSTVCPSQRGQKGGGPQPTSRRRYRANDLVRRYPEAQATLIVFIAVSGNWSLLQLAPPSCVPKTCPRRVQKYTCDGS